MKRVLLHTVLFCLIVLPSISKAQVSQDWVRKFVGLGYDNAAGIAADNSGNVWICGNNNWGSNTADIYTVRYNSAGTQTAGFLYNSPFNNADEARGIATDPAGNVYVVGRASVNSSTSDIVIIKYNSSAIQQWVSIFNTPQNYIDDATAIAVDVSGNVYITGHIVKGPFEYDYLTVKYNTAGLLQWSATYNGTANGVDMANDIAVDAAGNVYVTGLSAGRINRLFFVINTGYDYLTIKYNSSGVQQWVQRYNAHGGNDEAKSLGLDAVGNVYVTGSIYLSSGNLNCATIRYSTDGVATWVQHFAGPAGQHDGGNAIAVDGAGNAIVAGYSYNSSGRADVLTIKYNSAGAQLWFAIYDAGPGTHDLGKVMGLDQYGNVYVAAETSVPGVTGRDFLTIKYSAAGLQLWAVGYNGPENQEDNPTAMVVVNPPSFPPIAANAKIYVTGQSNNDVATIKYSQPLVIAPTARPAIVAEEALTASKFRIDHSPNPVTSIANIQFELPTDSRVTIDIYDPIGRKVFSLVDGFRKAGTHITKLNVATLAAGTYYYKFYARSGGKEFRQTKSIVIQR